MGNSSDDRTFATLAHVSYFVFAPFGALLIWLLKKDSSPFVDEQAKEALNFQLAVLIVSLITAVTCIGPLIVAVGGMVYAIIATVEVSKGNNYRYPYTIRLIK